MRTTRIRLVRNKPLGLDAPLLGYFELVTPETPTLVGRIPNKTGKKPKTADENRICSQKGCDTKLSKYNTKDACYRHRAPRFPRVRGRPR